MHEEKSAAYRRERERKEKLLKKETYIMHLQEEEKQKLNKKQEVIEKLVCSKYFIRLISQTTTDLPADQVLKDLTEKKADFTLLELPSIHLIDEHDEEMFYDDPNAKGFPFGGLEDDTTLFVLAEHYDDP